jgi:hypothetical protein
VRLETAKTPLRRPCYDCRMSNKTTTIKKAERSSIREEVERLLVEVRALRAMLIQPEPKA